MRGKSADAWQESLGFANPARRGRLLSKNRLKDLLLVVVSIGVALVAIEAIGHALGKGNFIRFRPSPEDMPANYFVSDPAMGLDIAKNYRAGEHTFADGTFPVFSNAYGCFDSDAPVPANYVLMIGDSFTWGYGPYEQKWGTLLEELLGRRVVKCGIPATGTRQHLEKARRVVDLIGHSPSLIVLGYYWNDLDDDYATPSTGVLGGYPTLLVKGVDVRTGEVLRYTEAELRAKRDEKLENEQPGIRKFIRDNSVVANLAVRGARALHEALTPRPPVLSLVTEQSLWDLVAEDVDWAKEAWRHHQQNLLDLKAFAEDHGARLKVVIVPDKDILYADPLREFFDKRHFSYFDLSQAMRAFAGSEEDFHGLHWRYDRHWNVLGNQLAAALTAGHFLEADVLPNLRHELSAEVDARLKAIKAKLEN